MSAGTSNFYVTGGTLPQDAPSYVERKADRDLFDGLLKGEFCYVLTSRQMGKSSLMVRTSNKLRLKGVNVVSLDLTAIGQNVTPEQWYDGLVLRMGRQLHLEAELEDFWRQQERISPVQRLMAAIRDVAMVKRPGPLVLFVDEIDTVRSLPFSTDEFFSAIRECYNRRTEDPDLNRITFCLLGVATPSDLIRDTRTTPFNIGRRVELNDFEAGEAAPLANGLGRETRAASALLERIYYWTNGHPYLTQRLCQAVAEDPNVTGPAGVDRLCEGLFLSSRARERDDNLLFVRERLLRSEVDRAGLLSLYDRVRNRKRVRDAEADPLISLLRLSGIVRVVEGCLWIRNRIYHRVFDRNWVLANMPDQELRRQREAFRRGISRGVGSAVALALAVFLLAGWVKKKIAGAQVQAAIQKLGAAYNGLASYEDHAVIQTAIDMQGARVITRGEASLAFEKPNKLNLRFKRQSGFGELDFHVVSDGRNLTVYMPRAQEYLVRNAPGSIAEIFQDVERIPYVDIPEPLYGILAGEHPQQALAGQARDIQFLRREELADRETYVLGWGRRHIPASLSGRATETNSPPDFLVTVWVDRESGLIRQVVQNLSGIATNSLVPDLTGAGFRQVFLDRVTNTTLHVGIRLNPVFPQATFAFNPPADARRVESFESLRRLATRPNREAKPNFDRTKLAQFIAPRDPQARPELIDLSKHYNAPLTESWHSDRPGNDLASLPRGLQTLAGSEFDVRGIVQVAGRATDFLKSLYPEAVKNIRVGRRCQRLQFLHGTGWTVADGTLIGHYLVHYVNGDKRAVPILYGFAVRDWWPQNDESKSPHGLVVAWQGENDASRPLQRVVRIYRTVWLNPLADVEISSIDFVSAMTDSAPFLIAITAE